MSPTRVLSHRPVRRLSTVTTLAAATAALAFPVLPADAAGSAVIRGVVLETGRQIAPGIDVSLYKASGEFVEATVTDGAAGAYEFTGLDAGSYLLWFENQNEAVSEWWENQPDKPEATPIPIGDGQTFVADAYLTQVSENLVAPTITGTATVGSTLTANRGTWYPTQAVEFQYQWLRNGAPIVGATQPTYVVKDADGGARISVSVIAVHQGATESATSSPTPVVTGGTPVQDIVAASAPVISGTPVVGSQLTATEGAFTPADASVSLQWLRGSTVVATGTTYTPTAADVGASLKVRATATKAGWTTATVDSQPFGPITAPVVVVEPPVSTVAPAVRGTARVGATLTATTGEWDDAADVVLQWTRAGRPIAGATGASYRLKPADAGARVGVVVTATNAAGTTTVAVAGKAVAKAKARLTAVVSSPKKGRLTVRTTVVSDGARTGKVTITATVGGKKVTRTYALTKGARKATLTGLRKGKATVLVRYSGDASTAAAKVTRSVKIR